MYVKNKKKLLLILAVLFIFITATFANMLMDIFFVEKFKTNDINSKYNVELARVIKVIDGDTVKLDTGGENFNARLKGIDCPETSVINRTYKQAYESNISTQETIQKGKIATKELKKIIAQNNNKVYFKTLGIDKYSRLLVNLYDNNLESINEKLVKSGLCTNYNYKK